MPQHKHEFVETYTGLVGYGLDRATDQATLQVYLQKISDDDCMARLLPRLRQEQMDALFGELATAGVSYIFVDSMKLSGAIGGKVRRVLERHYPDLVEGYRHIAINRKPYHEALMARAHELAEKHGLAWGG